MSLVSKQALTVMPEKIVAVMLWKAWLQVS